MTRTRRTSALAVLTIAAGCAAGCSAVASQPAPTPTPTPMSLSFAFTGRFADLQIEAFESALAQRSDGLVSMRIDDDYDPQTFKIEQIMIQGVASGDLDLAWVGVRAFSELGVHDFDPLIAPMMLDSLQTERAVLESDVPQRMLAGLGRVGVTGLALMGGELRHPIASGAPLVSLADFADIPFYSTHGDIPSASIAALGADNIDASPDTRNAGVVDGSIRAIEASVAFVAPHPEWLTLMVTANLNLWPSMGVLIVNPDRLASLSEPQRTALFAAAAEASASSVDLGVTEPAAVAAVCAAGGGFAVASPDQLGELRAAVEPVYDAIRSDPAAAAFLDDIAQLKAQTPPDTIAFPAECGADG